MSAAEGQMIFESFSVGPLHCNCSILGDPLSGRALVVDPGGDADRILSCIETHGLQIAAVLHTHAHLDHMLASGEIRARTGAPLCVHQADKFLWDTLERQCQAVGIACPETPQPDSWLKDDAALACCDGVAIHTPGHTPGSMSFWFQAHELLIAGDTLFRLGIGRTDLPGGSYQAIEASITQRLFTLSEDARVITGHGPETSLAVERSGNPFMGQF